MTLEVDTRNVSLRKIFQLFVLDMKCLLYMLEYKLQLGCCDEHLLLVFVN